MSVLKKCVSLVKAVTKNNTATSGWTRGVNVVASKTVATGTAIATFMGPGNTYAGHTGIFVGYAKDAAGNITGFNVYDQNWSAKAVTTHRIATSGAAGSVNDADSYYVVQVP
jgi:hypothetical protein